MHSGEPAVYYVYELACVLFIYFFFLRIKLDFTAYECILTTQFKKNISSE